MVVSSEQSEKDTYIEGMSKMMPSNGILANSVSVHITQNLFLPGCTFLQEA